MILESVAETSVLSELSKAKLFVAIICPPTTGTFEIVGFVVLLS